MTGNPFWYVGDQPSRVNLRIGSDYRPYRLGYRVTGQTNVAFCLLAIDWVGGALLHIDMCSTMCRLWRGCRITDLPLQLRC